MEGAARARSTRATTKRDRVSGDLGQRLRRLRLKAGLTQAQLAGGRYTGAYVSALENGLVRSSMAALTYLAERLDVSAEQLLNDSAPRWSRLDADLRLASGDWTSALDRYTALLEEAASRLERAQLQRGRAEALCRLQRPKEAIADATAAYEELKRHGRDTEAAYTAYWLANAHYQLSNVAEARAIGHQVLAEVRAGLAVEADFKIRLLVALAATESWDEHHDRALALLEEARALDQEIDDRGRAALLFSLATGYAQTGDHEAALRSGIQALALYDAAGASSEAAQLRNNLALAHLQAGMVDRAAELADEARRVLSSAGDQRMLAHVADTQAQIALARDDEAGVVRWVAEACELAQAAGDLQAEASARITLARMHRRAARDADAEAAYRSAADLLRTRGPHRMRQAALKELSELLTEQQRHEEAIALLREALDAGS
jgi:transcriptional regulator with XRE-family HTH domain